MASSSPSPAKGGTAKPALPVKPAAPAPRIVSARVFNDFAAI